MASDLVPTENGWLPIETAPKDGTIVRVSGDSGPYRIMRWEGIAYWGPPKNNFANESSWRSPGREGGADLRLAGYTPIRWRPLSNQGSSSNGQ